MTLPQRLFGLGYLLLAAGFIAVGAYYLWASFEHESWRFAATSGISFALAIGSVGAAMVFASGEGE